MAEKDILEKSLEGYKEVFADIVNVLLFKGRQLVQPEDLEDAQPHSYYKADGKIRELERDVAKHWERVTLRLALFGMENETAEEDDMPLRVIGYDGPGYRNQIRYATDGNGKRFLVKEPRYPVITLVLYFGTRRWSKPRTLLECLEVPEELKPYVNDYKMNLFEIAWLTDEQLAMFQSDFRIVAEYFVQLRKNKGYHPTPQKMKHMREVLDMMSVLTKDRRFEEACNLWSDGEEPNTMSEVLDRMINEGRNEGRIEGRNEGRIEGRNEGRSEGRIILCAELVRDGLLSLAEAATRVGLTVDAFSEKTAALGYPI